jgi:hypothetical protein
MYNVKSNLPECYCNICCIGYAVNTNIDMDAYPNYNIAVLSSNNTTVTAGDILYYYQLYNSYSYRTSFIYSIMIDNYNINNDYLYRVSTTTCGYYKNKITNSVFRSAAK